MHAPRRFSLGPAPLALGVAALAAVLAAPRPAVAQAQHTGAARNVSIRLSLPEGVTKARGILIFTSRGIASGWANGAPMKELAKRLSAAIAVVSGGDDLNDNSYPGRCKSGEFNGIGEALAKIAMSSGHPEIEHAPLVGIGHSHGGDYWNWYTACHPEKMAVVFVHASGGVNYSAAALKVPVLYELGTGDLIENGSKKPRAGMFVNRGKGAPMALVIGQGEGHNNVTPASLQMIIDLIEADFKLRVPADADPAKGPVKLYDIDETKGWLGDLYTKEIAPYAEFKGNKAHTSFLANAELAMKWKMTGPGLPTSIMLPSDTCSWCGRPSDEPAAMPGASAPSVPTSPPAATADAGAPPMGGPDATPPPPPAEPVTPSPSAVDAAPPSGGDKPAPTPAPAPAPSAGTGGSAPPATTTSGPVSGGCQVAGSGGAGGAFLLALAGLALFARRRRRL